MKKINLLLTVTITICLSANAQKINTPGKSQLKGTVQNGSDTSKKEQPAQYFIIGTDNDFKLLQKVITDPGNVTPNQVKAVFQWIQNKNQLMTDTTKKKAP